MPRKIYAHSTYNTKKKFKQKKSCYLTEYCFSFWLKIFFDWGYWGITQNGVLKWYEHQIKVHLYLRISYICPSDTICFQKSSGFLDRRI